MITSRQLRLAARPVGEVKPSDFELAEESIQAPGENEFLVEITHLSIDPAMRNWMNGGRSYSLPVEIGEVMRALGLARVVESRHPGFTPGDLVSGVFGVQTHALSDGRGVRRIDDRGEVSPAAHLGVLGLTGLTAYFGLLEVGQVNEGDTVLVSGAAGAVGTAVGQIAKIKGARVVGIAGGSAKCALMAELGFDAALDYRRGDLGCELHQATPHRVDVFFDNVGGGILDLGLARLNRAARVVLCGAVSQYNSLAAPAVLSNYLMLIVARATMAGFNVFDYADRHAEASSELAGWVADGRLRSVEDVVAGGVEDFPATLLRLSRGQNMGKLVLELRGRGGNPISTGLGSGTERRSSPS
jgi:NADPH-dependent curcumin reductase CurA